jgi:tetratricopeptide (TPR) repeat protein
MKHLPVLILILAALTTPSWAQDSLAEASQLSSQGRHAEAAAILQRASAAEPGNETIAYRLGTALVFDRRFNEARPIFKRLSGSWDSGLAAMASNSLTEMERIEAEELAAREQPPSAEELRARAEYEKRKALLERRQKAYELVAAKRDSEAIDYISKLDASGEATPDLLREEAAALDRAGKTEQSIEVLRRVAEMENPAVETRAQLAAALRKQGKIPEAYEVWRDLRDNHPDSPEGRLAASEIDALAPAWNPERLFWGELDLYAAYLQRYDIGVSNGRLRQGAFVPGARWIEPFLQADFSLDSDPYGGGADGISTVYNENLAGFHGGARIRPFAEQSFTLYVLGGIQKDLRGTEERQGEWFWELIAGINAFWAWGPGSKWASVDLQTALPGGMPVLPRSALQWTPAEWIPVNPVFDWFVEVGGDAAYYTRLQDAIGYGQSRQGMRLVRLGRAAAFDAYLLQNLVMDTEGSYYDNFFEAGPGVRFVTAPVGAAVFTTSVDYVLGSYLGRNSNDTRGTLDSTYADFRITASFSLRW